MPPRSAPLFLVGQSDAHLDTVEQGEAPSVRVHRNVALPLVRLQRAARDAGLDLTVISGFRDFDRQLSIWNRKVAGELAVLDSLGQPIDIATLTPRELVFAILRWSALPGASRHHWGTDVDVYDRAATPAGYEVQLVPAEVEHGGMHAALHEWLDERIASGNAFGFYRPYDADRGGVAPERWHLSHAPVAAECMHQVTPDVLAAAIGAAEMLLKDVVLENLPELFDRFVTNVTPPWPNETLA